MKTLDVVGLEFTADIAGALEETKVSIKVLTSVIREIATIVSWW
jgi:hypothetical protein